MGKKKKLIIQLLKLLQNKDFKKTEKTTHHKHIRQEETDGAAFKF